MSIASLSFESLLAILNSAIAEMGEPRKPSNATSYRVKDAVLGAFSAFFMQSESFLDYQRQLNSRSGRDNAQSLFDLERIPSIAQIRNILDRLAAQQLSGIFERIYQSLQAQSHL
jgi:hypothetical protein